jgi:hypothetical protein
MLPVTRKEVTEQLTLWAIRPAPAIVVRHDCMYLMVYTPYCTRYTISSSVASPRKTAQVDAESSAHSLKRRSLVDQYILITSPSCFSFSLNTFYHTPYIFTAGCLVVTNIGTVRLRACNVGTKLQKSAHSLCHVCLHACNNWSTAKWTSQISWWRLY